MRKCKTPGATYSFNPANNCQDDGWRLHVTVNYPIGKLGGLNNDMFGSRSPHGLYRDIVHDAMEWATAEIQRLNAIYCERTDCLPRHPDYEAQRSAAVAEIEHERRPFPPDLGAQGEPVAKEAVLAVVRAAWALVDNTGHHDLLPLAVNRDDWNELAARLMALKVLLPAEELPADPPHAVAYFWPAEAAFDALPAPTPDLGALSAAAEEVAQIIAHNLCGYVDEVDAENFLNVALTTAQKILALVSSTSQAPRPGWVKAYEAECQRTRADFNAQSCITENFPQITAPQQPAAQGDPKVREATPALSAPTPDLGAQGEPVAEDLEATIRSAFAHWRSTPGGSSFGIDSYPTFFAGYGCGLNHDGEVPTAPQTGSGVSVTEREDEVPIYEAFARYVGNADERASDFRMFATGYHAAAQAPRDDGRAQGGWRLVPTEPTIEMLDAYWRQTGESYEMRVRTKITAIGRYRAMLAAAPTQPSGVETIRQDSEGATDA